RRAEPPPWQGPRTADGVQRPTAGSSRLFFHITRAGKKSPGVLVPAQTELLQRLAVVLVEPLAERGAPARGQVGADGEGAAEGLVAAPARDEPVVAAEQDLRDGPAAPLGRLGVDGPLQEV